MFVMALMTFVALNAQSFEFQYKGKSIPDGETVTIAAEENMFGELSCETNPSNNPADGLVLALLSGSSATFNVELRIEQQTFKASLLQWCMGGGCVPFGKKEYLTKDVNVVEPTPVMFDATDITTEGFLLAKLTASSSLEQHSVYIRFTNGETAPDNGSSQMWWGYYNESYGFGGIGTGNKETFDAAIYIPAGNAFVGNSKIKAIRVWFDDVSAVSNLKVWISKNSLPENVSTADVVQDVDASSLVHGCNDIELSTPFDVNDEAIYVGYTFTSGGYCVMQGGDYVDNSLYLRSSQSVTSWGAIDYFGCLALQILIEGSGFPENMAVPKNFKNAVVELGNSIDVMAEIRNDGGNTIESLAYTISSDGNTSAEKTIENLYIPYGGKMDVPFQFEADATEGKVLKTLTITKVNGNDNTATEKSATGYLQTVAELKTYPRTTLIEEFTTEYCGWCPTAAGELASTMSTYPDLASQVAIVCHHSGYYTDWLTIDADVNYTWFYNEGGGTYAPAFMWDRYAENGKTAVTGRLGEISNYKSMIESRLARPAYVSLDLTANFNETKDKIVVSTKSERTWDFCDTPARITLILTEDNIAAKSQSGANGSFTHQHVSRAVNETWGAVLEWNDNKASYSYTFDLDSSWKKEDLKVVAFVSGYDSSDPTNCTVENAAVTVPGNEVPQTVISGDANGDNVVNAADIVEVVNYIMGSPSASFDEKAADVNGDGVVNAADIVLIVNNIMNTK